MFRRATGVLDGSGVPIIKPALQSIGAILLVAVDHREMRIVGLLNPDATLPFIPNGCLWSQFVKFAGVFSHTNIATEWIQTSEMARVDAFPHRHIR